jgi:hypothetical protein
LSLARILARLKTMPRPKKPKPPPKPNKTKLLERLVEKPAFGIREWVMREMSILNRLENKYPLEFLNIINFGKKLPSLAVLSSTWGESELARKFFAFNYEPPKQEEIVLAPNKFGEDVYVEKKKSLREIL